MKKTIQFGIFGLGRGSSYYRAVLANNGSIVAVCDKNEERLAEAKKELGEKLAAYTDFDAFLNHPGMEAVFLCNYFDQHAPYAIRALEKNLHVLSECTAAATMAESVALVRTAEKSRGIYMLAENYPFMKFNQEMKRVFDGGTLGKCLFAEGEYNHPQNPTQTDYIKMYRPNETHWRNRLPRTYYITHSLGPLMYITGAFPRRVTAMPVFAPTPPDMLMGLDVGDRAAIITTLNDDDSVFRVTGCAAFGAHGNSYRICGIKGQIENLRDGTNRISLRYNPWEKPEGVEDISCYEADWNDPDVALIEASGHGGGDFFVIREFFRCIRENVQPFFDVHCATTMSSVAILAHRSLLERGVPYDIPDFHSEEARKKYENDTLTPFYGADGSAPSLPCCSHTEHEPSERELAEYRALLADETVKIPF